MPHYRKPSPVLASQGHDGKIVDAGARALPELKCHDGRCIPDLNFGMFFIGSEWNSCWKKDCEALEEALRTALTDAHLNSVFEQYMPPEKSAAAGSLAPAAVIEKEMPFWVTKQDIEALITELLANGKEPFPPEGASPDSFAALFVLPQGRILVAPEGFASTSMNREPA
jgi:hypothetical protein